MEPGASPVEETNASASPATSPPSGAEAQEAVEPPPTEAPLAAPAEVPGEAPASTGPVTSPAPPPDKTLRPLSQELPIVTLRALEGMNRSSMRIVVSISEQRAWLYSGTQMVIQTPVSTGKRTHATPRGEFRVTRLEAEHSDKNFGNFTDKDSRVIRAGVDARYDYAPAGSRFQPAPKQHFIEFDPGSGAGFRAGDPPGYPSTRGDVLVPRRIAALLFSAVEVGTPVEIRQ